MVIIVGFMCDTPLTINAKSFKWINGHATNKIPIACGKCPTCRINKVREWVFRLLQEEKRSFSSFFLTFTYNTTHVPITDNAFMTLDKSDMQKFFKRLRKRDKKEWKKAGYKFTEKPAIKYYCAGEYGSKTYRPHYHVILFNVFNLESVFYAWTKEGVPIGSIHIGDTNSDSVAYTVKYLDKTTGIPWHANDDRLKEFSIMSKNLGDNYLSPAIRKYHKEDLSRYYVMQDGWKVGMPRYYADKLKYTDEEMEIVSKKIDEYKMDLRIKKEKRILRIYKGKISIEEYEDIEKHGKFVKFNHNSKKERDGF